MSETDLGLFFAVSVSWD